MWQAFAIQAAAVVGAWALQYIEKKVEERRARGDLPEEPLENSSREELNVDVIGFLNRDQPQLARALRKLLLVRTSDVERPPH